jgi:integrase
MASSTVSTARPGERVKIAPRLYEYGRKDGLGCSYYADIILDGRQVRRKLAASTRRTARVEQTHLESDNSKGLVATPTKLTLGEVADEWFKQLSDLKPRSLEAYELQLRKNVIPFLGAKSIQSIKPKNCAALQRWLRDERKLSPSSQAAALNVLNSVLKYAVREEYVHSNPLDRIEKRAKRGSKKAAHRYLSPAEITGLLEHSNGYTSLFELCVYTGLRMSEALGLIWSDIDLAGGTILVQAQLSRASNIADAKRVPTKTDETREVAIDAGLVEHLRGLKEESFAKGRAKPDDFVFQTETGNPLLYRNVWGAFDVAAAKAGLNPEGGRKLRPHDLRRTAASLLINAGLPAPYVAAQLGHTVQVLYSTYTGLLEAQQGTNREAHLAALEAFRKGDTGRS